MRILLLALLMATSALWAAPRQIDDYRWQDVDRIVAIGDIHGDYQAYIAVLQAAKLVDKRGRWIAGHTHLVQTGDIPDRGPDTLRIIEHLEKLSRQAERSGGRVHALIGNHEAMNVQGDLRYVSPGEFAAFADRRSASRRDRYFELSMQQLQRDDPERFAALPGDFRAQWEQQHPLGWLEHRMAWDPRWQGEATLYRWVMQAKVAVQLNGLLFLHGGLSHAYCGNSLQSLTEMARAALAPDAAAPARSRSAPTSLLEDPLGPLWYRGLSGNEPAASSASVEQILARHHARHLVIGHTPTGGVIWPRLDGRVILIDTGMSAAYGSRLGWLEVTPEGISAGYAAGKLPLPLKDSARLDYLQAVVALQPDNAVLEQRLMEMRTGQRERLLGPVTESATSAGAASDTESGAAKSRPEGAPPTCDTAH